MRTVPPHSATDCAPGDATFDCDYCGSRYLRSELRRDRAGLLACEKDYGGDVVTISEENAQSAQEPLVTLTGEDGGNYSVPPVETPPTIVFPDGVVGF